MKDKKHKHEECSCDETCDCGCQDGKECNCENNACDCGCENENHTCDCGCEDEQHTCDCGCEHQPSQLEVVTAQALDYLNLARQIQADFDNYRKRNIESVKLAREDGIIACAETILPAIDVFEVALKQVTDEKSRAGILMVKEKIETALKNLGIEKIQAVGEELDPNKHNVVLTDNKQDTKDNIVTEEYSAGYMFKNKVIKHSQVRVNKIN